MWWSVCFKKAQLVRLRNPSWPSSFLLPKRHNVSSESGMGVHLCVHARVSEASVVRAVPVLHIHVSLSLSSPLFLSFLPAPLSPVHLSLLDSSHYCLGTSSACPAKARHWNGIWERGSVWEIVNEEREEDADRVRQGGWVGGDQKREKKTLKQTWSSVREQRRLQHN